MSRLMRPAQRLIFPGPSYLPDELLRKGVEGPDSHPADSDRTNGDTVQSYGGLQSRKKRFKQTGRRSCAGCLAESRLSRPSRNVASYRAFVVFHAGVGRDIDLVSSLGYDPAPSDIPSLYLDAAAFQSFHGTPGVPVSNGAFTIPNSIVMPETESRSIPGIGGDVFLEYGINGLLCASFGNFLGLPDLFDTKTGVTAIGRFGLMDGQGIFSFSGVFPPEPSAWEKYWLGWIAPIPVPVGTSVLQLPAVSVADTVYRVPIGPQEYYLVENRNRDPQKNGQHITSAYKGSSTVFSFPRDTIRLQCV